MKLILFFSVAFAFISCSSSNQTEEDVVIADFYRVKLSEIPFDSFQMATSPIPNSPFKPLKFDTIDFFKDVKGKQGPTSAQMVKSIHDEFPEYYIISDCIDSVEHSIHVFKKDGEWRSYGVDSQNCY